MLFIPITLIKSSTTNGSSIIPPLSKYEVAGVSKIVLFRDKTTQTVHHKQELFTQFSTYLLGFSDLYWSQAAISTAKRPELSEVFTYCVWHLDHGVNISLDVIITGLQADDVINNLIHLVKNT